MIIEIALITAMAALNLAVVPGRARRDELVGNAFVCKRFVKTDFSFSLMNLLVNSVPLPV